MTLFDSPDDHDDERYCEWCDSTEHWSTDCDRRPVDANDIGLVRNDHPSTAKAAAHAAFPRSGTWRRKVLDAIALRPRTDDELQHDLTMSGNTERPRRVELVDGGWINDSGERRRTAGGQDAIVWQLARPLPAEADRS